MPARTVEEKILNQIIGLNQKILNVERKFGIGSEQYQRYINAITATFSNNPSAFTLNTESGRLRLKKSKKNAYGITQGELNALRGLPTVKQSMDDAKRAIAKTKLRKEGTEPTQENMAELRDEISDEEALDELAAKQFIQDMEDEHGKLKYDETVRKEMKESGAKSYSELRQIIEEGRRRKAEKRAKHAAAQRKYRSTHKAEINRRQNEYRRAHREEVNRKQREYRARRKAEKAQNT